MKRRQQEELYREQMGDEALGTQLIAGAKRKNTWTCACGHPLYDHSIRRETSSSEYIIGACGITDCPCGSYRNPHRDPDSVPLDVWEFMLKRKGLLPYA